MKLRMLWLVSCLLFGLAVSGFANTAPIIEDRYVSTVQATPVTFEIRAEDTDIDPADASIHPLRFTILEGPIHGVLIGDLTELTYRPPHTAVVELTYVPADGYVGSDIISIMVTDPFGKIAVGTIDIEVVPRRAQGVLAGNWSTKVSYNNSPTGGLSAFRTQFTQVYRIGSLMMKGIASVQMQTTAGAKDMVFDSLRFQVDYSISNIDHTSTLAFDPDASVADLFDHWRALTRFSLLGIDFAHTLYLLNTQTDSYQALSAQVSFGSVSVANTVRFDLKPDCGFVFSSNDTHVSWQWCDLALRASIGFNCAGFEELRLSAGNVPIPGFGWLLGDVFLNTAITFDMDGKRLSANARWLPRDMGCLQVLASLDLTGPVSGPVSGNISFDSIRIYGLRFEHDITSAFGDISVIAATALEAGYNAIVTGQTDYSSMFRISGPLLACCGHPGSWSMATYFHDGSTMLFDWGMTIVRADVVLSNQVNVNFETIFRSGFFGDPTLELTLGWMVRW